MPRRTTPRLLTSRSLAIAIAMALSALGVAAPTDTTPPSSSATLTDVTGNSDDAKPAKPPPPYDARFIAGMSGSTVGEPIPLNTLPTRSLLSPDQSLLVTITDEPDATYARLWDLDDGVQLGEALKADDHYLERGAIQFSEDGSRVVITFDHDTKTYVLDTDDGTLVGELPIKQRERTGSYYKNLLSISDDGSTLLTVSRTEGPDGQDILNLWRVEPGMPLICSLPQGGYLTHASLEEDGDMVVSVVGQERVRTWDLSDCSLKADLMRDDFVLGAFFSHYSDNIITVHNNSRFHVWDEDDAAPEWEGWAYYEFIDISKFRRYPGSERLNDYGEILGSIKLIRGFIGVGLFSLRSHFLIDEIQEANEIVVELKDYEPRGEPGDIIAIILTAPNHDTKK